MSERSEEQQADEGKGVDLRDLEVPEDESPDVKGGVSDDAHRGEIDVGRR